MCKSLDTKWYSVKCLELGEKNYVYTAQISRICKLGRYCGLRMISDGVAKNPYRLFVGKYGKITFEIPRRWEDNIKTGFY
jgi:hypothetical protein